MKNFQRIAENLDLTPLRIAIARQPELWAEDTFLRHYPQGPFGMVESIMLRFPQKVVFDEKDPRAAKKLELYKQNKLPGFDQHESIAYPSLLKLPEARPLFMFIFGLAGGTRLGRVMVNKIKPGGRIFRHADNPEHVAYWTRFHIAINSQPGVRFLCGDEEVYMAPGEAWWFRNAEEHEVINDSADDRIHMVVDVRCGL